MLLLSAIGEKSSESSCAKISPQLFLKGKGLLLAAAEGLGFGGRPRPPMTFSLKSQSGEGMDAELATAQLMRVVSADAKVRMRTLFPVPTQTLGEPLGTRVEACAAPGTAGAIVRQLMDGYPRGRSSASPSEEEDAPRPSLIPTPGTAASSFPDATRTRYQPLPIPSPNLNMCRRASKEVAASWRRQEGEAAAPAPHTMSGIQTWPFLYGCGGGMLGRGASAKEAPIRDWPYGRWRRVGHFFPPGGSCSA